MPVQVLSLDRSSQCCSSWDSPCASSRERQAFILAFLRHGGRDFSPLTQQFPDPIRRYPFQRLLFAVPAALLCCRCHLSPSHCSHSATRSSLSVTIPILVPITMTLASESACSVAVGLYRAVRSTPVPPQSSLSLRMLMPLRGHHLAAQRRQM